MYFEIGCRDFAVERSLDLVVYTGIKEGIIVILEMLFRDPWGVSVRGRGWRDGGYISIRRRQASYPQVLLEDPL